MRFELRLPCQAGRSQNAATTALVILCICRSHLLEHFHGRVFLTCLKASWCTECINSVIELVPADRLVPLRYNPPAGLFVMIANLQSLHLVGSGTAGS